MACMTVCKVSTQKREVFLVAALLGLLLSHMTAAAPAQHYGGSTATNACIRQENTEALCQRCAKNTKSVMVYPMCCRDQEDVKAWCVRYLEYGLRLD